VTIPLNKQLPYKKVYHSLITFLNKPLKNHVVTFKIPHVFKMKKE